MGRPGMPPTLLRTYVFPPGRAGPRLQAHPATHAFSRPFATMFCSQRARIISISGVRARKWERGAEGCAKGRVASIYSRGCAHRRAPVVARSKPTHPAHIDDALLLGSWCSPDAYTGALNRGEWLRNACVAGVSFQTRSSSASRVGGGIPGCPIAQERLASYSSPEDPQGACARGPSAARTPELPNLNRAAIGPRPSTCAL